MKKIIKMFVHRNKDDNYDMGEYLALSEKAMGEFKYALLEVECDVELDTETGKTKLLSAKTT